MTGPSHDKLLAALDLLEESDARNLAWGLTDESWTQDDLIDFLGKHLADGIRRPASRNFSRRTSCPVAEGMAISVPDQDGRVSAAVHPAPPIVSRPALAVGQSPGVRLPLPPQAARIPRAEPRPRGGHPPTGDQDVSAARSHPGRACPRRPVPVPVPVDRGRGDLLGAPVRDRSGDVVGAGTGSGKTLAFYLPALSQLAAEGAAGPRVVAIYPRNELLKDQLATALREVRSLRSAGSRSLVVGAYFGPTPSSDRRTGYAAPVGASKDQAGSARS